MNGFRSEERMLLINDYKDLEYRFHWLTVERVIDLFCDDPCGFRVHRPKTPSYELGQRCPTIALQCCSREKGIENPSVD